MNKVGNMQVVAGRSGKAVQFGPEIYSIGEINQSMGDLVKDQFTVMFWISRFSVPTGKMGYESLFSTLSVTGVQIDIRAVNQIRVIYAGDMYHIQTSKLPILAGSGWVQVAFTVDGKKTALYVNGEATEKLAKSEKPPGFGFAMTLGAHPRTKPDGSPVAQEVLGSCTYFGMIDDLRIYDVALTAEQVAAADSEL